MANQRFFKDYRPFVRFDSERYGKATLFENEHILVGVNCLEPNQEMEKHAHEIPCRFYIILEGEGRIWVGDEEKETGIGMVISAPIRIKPRRSKSPTLPDLSPGRRTNTFSSGSTRFDRCPHPFLGGHLARATPVWARE